MEILKKRGRPVVSVIRQNIVELLHLMKEAHGYDIAKTYMEIFPRVTMRSIYYHLNKGLETKEFKISKTVKEKGDFSWGPETTRVYYSLGEGASPKNRNEVKEFFEKKKS